MLIESDEPQIGELLPDFSLPDLDGSEITLSKSAEINGAVVAFICNHCPYVQAVIERLVKDSKQLKSMGVQTLAVMSNDYLAYPADSPAKMKDFALRHQFDFPYLLDENQEVAREFGAVCTPDFYAVNKNLELVYRGRLDDVSQSFGSQIRHSELVDAMKAHINGGFSISSSAQYPSLGCSIKWKNV